LRELDINYFSVETQHEVGVEFDDVKQRNVIPNSS